MVRSLFSDALEGKIGSEVKDPYGRRVGVLVGFSSELDGRVTSVEVLVHGTGEIHDYPSEAVILQGGVIIVKPEWKMKAEKAANEYEKAVKRFEGLRELYNKKEIPSQIYKQFARQLESKIKKLRDEIAEIKRIIKKRMGELEDEKMIVIRTKTELKMLLMSGDIRPDDYRKAMERLRDQEEIISRELRDLEQTLKKLEDIEVRNFGITEEKKEEKSVAHEEEHKMEIPSATSPIPVKIIE